MNIINHKRAITEAIRMSRFEDTYARLKDGMFSCEEAALLLGCSLRHFHRLRGRYDVEGLQGLRDRRVGRESPRRATRSEVAMVTKLYKEGCGDFNTKHFHSFLKLRYSLCRSYSWVRNILNSQRLIFPQKKKGQHRLQRPRRPMIGMMMHQDASKHYWVPDVQWDLIVTMDDATSEIYSAFFVEEEGTNSSFRGIKETIEKCGIFCSFYVDRGSHYFITPKAGGKVDKINLTQVGRALRQLKIESIAAYSPQARGRSERMFGTIQGRLPQELAFEGITTMEEANRYLREIYLPQHNKEFTVSPASDQSAFIKMGDLDIANVLCIQEARTVMNDNTIRYGGKTLQIYGNEYRHHFVKASVEVHEYHDRSLGVFYGPMCIGLYDSDGNVKEKHNNAKHALKAA